MLPQQPAGLFTGKNIVAEVGNPTKVEEKGFLSTTEYLEFEVTISGDINYKTPRRDHDFQYLSQYLMTKYPNVLIPNLEKL